MDASIPAVLTTLSQKFSASASAIYRPRFGVGITDWRIIALLAGQPWIAPVQICEATGLDKAAVSRSLQHLCESGLVEVGYHERNRRRLPLALTAKGLAVHDEIVGVSLARQEKLLKDFTPEERALLMDFLRRMRRQVETPRALD